MKIPNGLSLPSPTRFVRNCDKYRFSTRFRRQCADGFVKQVTQAVEGLSPFTPIGFPEAGKMQLWLAQFPDWAMQGSGLGDLSIMHDWQRLCETNRGRRVDIWSLDAHLSAYDSGTR